VKGGDLQASRVKNGGLWSTQVRVDFWTRGEEKTIGFKQNEMRGTNKNQHWKKFGQNRLGDQGKNEKGRDVLPDGQNKKKGRRGKKMALRELEKIVKSKGRERTKGTKCPHKA